MGSHEMLSIIPHLCAEFGDRGDLPVRDQRAQARRMKEELEDINTRVNNAVQAFEQASNKLCLERAYQTNIEFVENVGQLDSMLSDAEGRRKYQQRVSVFIVGYRRACGLRKQLLSQLSEFFSQQRVEVDEEVQGPLERLELEDIALKVTDALWSAEQGILKLADLSKEIKKFNSSAAVTKDTKGSRKKLEKSINQAKENISQLRQKLKEAQHELEAKDRALAELLRQTQGSQLQNQLLQSQLEIVQKSIRNLSQDYEGQKKLLEEELRRQQTRVEELESAVREGPLLEQEHGAQLPEAHCQATESPSQLKNEIDQHPGEGPEGEVLAGDVEEEERGSAAASIQEEEAPELLEDLLEDVQTQTHGIGWDGQADVAELKLKVEQHVITLQEAQRELLLIQGQELDEVREVHQMERRRLRDHHQWQRRHLQVGEADGSEEVDWMSEELMSSDIDSEQDSTNKEAEVSGEPGRSRSRGSSRHSSRAPTPRDGGASPENLLPLQSEDSPRVVSGDYRTLERSQSQFGSGGDGVVLPAVTEHEVTPFEPTSEGGGLETTQSSPSPRTPCVDVSALAVADGSCDKGTQCPEGGGDERRESPGSPPGPHSGRDVRAASSSDSLRAARRICQMLNQFTKTLSEMLLHKGLEKLARQLDMPDTCRSEGQPEGHDCLAVVTRWCDTLLPAVISAFSGLLASLVIPGTPQHEGDPTSPEESVPDVRPFSAPTAPLHREEDKQRADAATQTEDAGDTQQQVGSATVGEWGRCPTHCARLQERARDCGERPAGDGPVRGPPDYMAVFFTRLDLERNLRALRQGLVCGRLPKNTYEHVAAVMQGYGELQQERLCSLVKSYSSFVRSWEAVRRTSAEGPPPRPLATKMEALHRQRARCWCRVNSRYSERRLQLAALLTSTLKQVEAESGIFLIKPVVSWQGRLESTSKIGTCRKEMVRKGRASTLPTACSPAEDGLTGGEEISGQRLHIASRLCGETWRHGNKTHLELVERAEVTGKTCSTTTPRLPPI